MKKTIQTIIVAMFVVMITGTFAFAAAATSGGKQLPVLPPWLSDHGRAHHHLPEVSL